eukprot:2388657-Rhodomonas_salina.1
MQVCWSEQEEESTRAEVVREGGITLAVSLCRTGDPEAQAHAAEALALLSHHRHLRAALIDGAAVPALLHLALRHCPQPSDLLPATPRPSSSPRASLLFACNVPRPLCLLSCAPRYTTPTVLACWQWMGCDPGVLDRSEKEQVKTAAAKALSHLGKERVVREQLVQSRPFARLVTAAKNNSGKDTFFAYLSLLSLE